MEEYLIAVFQRPGDAALAQRYLTQQQLKVAMMPSPRGLSTSCGLSVRFASQDADAICAALWNLFPEPERVSFFRACKEEGTRRFYPLDPAK